MSVKELTTTLVEYMVNTCMIDKITENYISIEEMANTRMSDQRTDNYISRVVEYMANTRMSDQRTDNYISRVHGEYSYERQKNRQLH